jgi:UDP-glucose-4-epimerase GalE
MREPGRYFDSIVRGTIDVLEAMRQALVGSIVFSSTCAVYGNAERVPIVEDTPPRPENPYGASKLMAEEVLDWYASCHGVRSMSLRYFNAAGAAPEADLGEDATTAANLVPRVMSAILGNAPALTVFGTDYPTPDGTAIRDYVHVVDLAEAHVLALRHLVEGDPLGGRREGGLSDVLNLGSGRGSSVREVVAMAGEVSGREVPIEFGPRRSGDPVALWAANGKAREMLGWQPRHDLHDIVESAWRWHAGVAGR